MDSVRESMRPVPHFLQPALTWLTGMPLAGQKPLFRKKPWHFAASALGQLLAGAVGSELAIESQWWIILPATLTLTVGGARLAFVTVSHQAIHGAFSRDRRINRAVADVVGVILLLPGHDAFRKLHVAGHHRHLAGAGDPDNTLVLEVFRPGTPKPKLWRRLWLSIAAPAYHAKYFTDRIRSVFIGGGKRRRLFAALSLAGYAALPVLDATLLVSWHLPVIVGYQAVALIQLVGLHLWGQGSEANPRGYADITIDRFAGTAAPGPDASTTRWAGWVARMLFCYLPLRVAVFAGEIAAVHALHHAAPCDRDWPNAIFERRRKLDAFGCKNRRAYWGYFRAADAVFESIAALQPDATSMRDRSRLVVM